MFLRIAVALSVVAAVSPAFAEPLGADAARKFVAGKSFNFNCFEGSTGSGRIFHDGSVVGMVRLQGSGPVRFIRMPPGTLFAKGESVCSYVKGAFFNPCFNLEKTSDKSFRGAVSGFGFAYCEFTRGNREMIASVSATPDDKPPMPRSIRRSVKTPHPVSTASVPQAAAAPATTGSTTPAAAPTTPVKAEPLPKMEETGMRGSVSQ